MNAIEHPNIFMRSLATRDTGKEDLRRAARSHRRHPPGRLRHDHRRDLRHRPGRRGHRALRRCVAVRDDPEFGAASQLEKIDMLDFADFVAINKFDRKGAEDALRDVRKQYQRNRELFTNTDEMPVFGTMAARFNDDGVTALFQAVAPALVAKGLKLGKPLPLVAVKASSRGRAIVPAERTRYLAEIAEAVRGYHKHTAEQARIARERQALRISKKLFEGCNKDAGSLPS
jgi:methylmalonyl-CoA mutase